jgi:hypothetical protein
MIGDSHRHGFASTGLAPIRHALDPCHSGTYCLRSGTAWIDSTTSSTLT